ncbi:TonB-dependent receptor [Alteromonas sp. I4]|nr:TonB-dependent receptor [Alteromonas sp. I4]
MTIRTLSYAVAIACSAGFSAAAAAQSNSVETITVTGSRSPIAIDKLAASVTVLTEQEIQASGATQVTDLLRGLPGISISQSGSPGSLTELRLRGSETNHLLVLIDGVVANDISQGSLFDFAHLTAANIVRIELHRGAQSALWGSGAVAGVLSITTSAANQADSTVSLTAGAGNADTYRASASASHRGEHMQANVSASIFDTAGDNVSRTGNERDGYENTALNAGIQWQPAAQHNLDAKVRYVDYTNEYDGTDYVTTGLPADADNVTDGEQFTTQLNWQYQDSDLPYRSLVSVQYNRNENNNTTSGADAGGTLGERKQFTWTQFVSFGDTTLAVGSEFLRREFEQSGPIGWDDPNYRGEDSTSSVFAELTGLGTDKLDTQFSLRYDDNERFSRAWSYRAGARYAVTRNIKVFASVGQAVKTPSFTELYGYYPSTFIGNPALLPEQSQEVELGADIILPANVTLQLSVFSTRLEDEILGFVYDANSGMYTAQNASEKSRRDGFEASAQWRTDDVSLTAHYSYLDASQGDGTAQTVELRRPNHTGSITAAYSFPVQGLSAYIKAAYTGTRLDTFYPPWPATAQTLNLAPYWLTTVNVDYKIDSDWQVGLRVDNALDESFEDIVGYQGSNRRILAHTRYSF